MNGIEDKRQIYLYNIPDSLKMWVSDNHPGITLTPDLADRQVFDLTTLPEDNWINFQEIAFFNIPLNYFYRESKALRNLNSKEHVKKYLETELIKGDDPYFLIDKISHPGSGIRDLYARLISISKIENLTENEKVKVDEMISYWDEATLDIICNEEAYFTKTAAGNPGTISEYFGSMLASSLHISDSPYMHNGKYKNRFLSALDYQGIVNGKYTRHNHDQFYRQTMLLRLLYKSQGLNKLPQEYWQALENNEDFSITLHYIAVNEGFSNSKELLINAINYAWKKSLDGELLYKWVSLEILDDHFRGKTAADKFLSNPAMQFEEKFNSLRSNIQQDYLWDFRQINEESRDFLVLLECNQNGNKVNVTYALIGENYSEASTSFKIDEKEIQGLSDSQSSLLIQMVNNFLVFKQNYLQKLSTK